MKSHSFGLFHAQGSFQPRHSRTRRIEWLIAVVFLLTLIMASGAFFNHSTAANLKESAETNTQSAARATDRSTSNKFVEPLALAEAPAGKSMAALDNDSCEL